MIYSVWYLIMLKKGKLSILTFDRQEEAVKLLEELKPDNHILIKGCAIYGDIG
ncbi:MAG: hypothetical protein J6N45_09730 [Alphaproteobacteria bacterium]|nr:hypothetical protein [Alphaproteobacteria bacterium]